MSFLFELIKGRQEQFSLIVQTIRAIFLYSENTELVPQRSTFINPVSLFDWFEIGNTERKN